MMKVTWFTSFTLVELTAALLSADRLENEVWQLFLSTILSVIFFNTFGWNHNEKAKWSVSYLCGHLGHSKYFISYKSTLSHSNWSPAHQVSSPFTLNIQLRRQVHYLTQEQFHKQRLGLSQRPSVLPPEIHFSHMWRENENHLFGNGFAEAVICSSVQHRPGGFRLCL